MNKNSKIYITGHTGLVGSAILKALQEKNFTNLIYKTHSELDLTNQRATSEFFNQERPEYVIHAAGKVGGILANATSPAEFIYNNLMMGTNIVNS